MLLLKLISEHILYKYLEKIPWKIFAIDIITLLVSDILLNNINSPVTWSGAVCLHVKMAILDHDVNLQISIFKVGSVFKRKFMASKVQISVVNWMKNLMVIIFSR